MSDDWNTRTKLVHSGTRRSQYNEVSEAIFLTQGFVYDSAEAAEARFLESGPDEFIYARYGNPTVAMFEERIAALEGAEDAFATASGMAAVSGALTAMLAAGDHVVAARALFGSCLYVLEEILTRYGVDVTFVDGTDLEQWRAAIRPDTKSYSSRRSPIRHWKLLISRRYPIWPMRLARRLSWITFLPRRSSLGLCPRVLTWLSIPRPSTLMDRAGRWGA